MYRLPPSPPSFTGWPWTEDTPPLPPTLPDDRPWPKICIVTPSYNQGHFIEETIRSVLLQGYPNLEYIIIDGGSTDNSVEIIKKYAPWLTYWESEKDRGQTHAINKGLKHCTGDIFNWLNSDDQFLPGALAAVAQAWIEYHPRLVVGYARTIEASSSRVLLEWHPRIPVDPFDFVKHSQLGMGIAQPATFLSLSLVRNLGVFDEDLHYVFDYALYLRVFTDHSVNNYTTAQIIPEYLAQCMSHVEAKTSTSWSEFTRETKTVLRGTSYKLTALNQLGVLLYLHSIDTMERVNTITEQLEPRQKLQQLVKLLFRYPHVGWSRYYWGSIKRLFMRISIISKKIGTANTM